MPVEQRPRRRWRGWLLAGCLLGLGCSAAAEPGPPAPGGSVADTSASGVSVHIVDGLLTLEAAGAPLGEVLRAIGAAGSFRVLTRGALAAPVSVSLAGQPLESAIRQLVRGHTLIVTRAGPASDRQPLTAIRVVENRRATPEATSELAERPAGAEGARGEPVDRASFVADRRALMPPTRADLLVELGAADRATRVAATAKAGALAPRAALELLAGVLSDADPLVRSRALAILTRLAPGDARALLRERAVPDADPALRSQALHALATTSGERAVTVFGRAVRRDPAPQVRLAAVRPLVRAGGAWAQGHLARAAQDPTRRSPRRPGGRSLLHRSSRIEDQSAAVAARMSLRAR